MRDGDAIVKRYGGRRYTNYWIFRCPAHQDKSPSATLGDSGRLHCFAGCSYRDLAAALDRDGFPDDGKSTRPISKKERREDETQAIGRAQREWADCDAPTHHIAYNTSVVASLLEQRGILVPVPPCIRRLGVNGRIAAWQRLDGVMTAVHCRYYHRTGKGWIIGRTSGHGGAVRLATPTHELGLSEGVENALAAIQLFNIPTWATLTADLLPYVDIPPGVTTLHIFADNDKPGRLALVRATKRFEGEGYIVRPWLPVTDWNDRLLLRN